MRTINRLCAGASGVALALAAVSAVHAQETTAAIHGAITNGATPAANQAVTIVHTPSGTRLATSTNANGVFDARSLRVGGPYTITVGAKSYSDIYLELGKTFDFSADLAAAAQEVAAVEVVATAVRDNEQGPKTIVNRDAIAGVVSVNRDIRDIARRDILVSQDLSGSRAGANQGGISIAGSNPRFNRISVDGVSAQDSFGLAQGGLPTSRGPVTLDAVEQAVVAAVPTDVENGDFTGGALNLVLRSGTNSFHGTAFLNYLNDGFVGTKIGQLTVKAPISQKNYGGFLSGPIIKDKVFFAAAYETYRTFDTTLYGTPNQGLANTFTNLTQSTVDQVVSTYNSRYASKFDLGGIEATKPVTDEKYSVKLDWNINDRHRASLTYRYAKASAVLRTDLGQTTAALDSHWYEQANEDRATTAELHSNWSDKLRTTLRATYREYVNSQMPPSGQNYADVAVCTAPTSDATLTSCQSGFSQVRFGPDQFRHANLLSELETRLMAQAEYTTGNHLLKLGVQARRAAPFDLFVSASHGVYYFDSLADFAAGRAGSLTYQNAVTGNPNDAAFDTAYWTYSLYGQDAIEVTPDLKVTAGARFDLYHYPDKPILNPNFLARNGYSNQSTIDGKSMIQPRISAEWRALDNLKLTAGFGKFGGGTPDVLTGTPFYNTGYATTSVTFQRSATGIAETTGAPGYTAAIGAAALDNLNLDPQFGYQVPSTVSALQRGTLTGTPLIPPLGEVFALDPNFKLPAQWKAYLGAQWDVRDWRVGVDFVASQAVNEIDYYDSRAQKLVVNGVQQYLPDGRIRYDGLGTVTGKTSTNLGSNRDLVITNRSKGNTWNLGFTLARSWDWGGDFAVGYARSRAIDLGPGLRFGTTAGSLYASVPAYGDPNRSDLGRSVDEIKDRFKIQLGFRKEFWKDNETRITLFGERQSGRPFGFSMQDRTSGRSPVFGVNRTGQALYVPDFAGDTNTADLNVGLVTFATQADLDLFKGYVTKFNLPNGQVVPKYSNTNKSVNRLDLQLSQQLPSVIPGHKFKIVADIRNVLNLLDSDWGAVSEYNDVNTVTRVDCADAAGAAVPTTSAACPRYRYSSVSSSINPTTNNAMSLWYAQISFRYEF